MPIGTCTECGQEEVLGNAADEGMPFLCCDCDSEMAAYTEKDRSDLKRASRERMEKLVMGTGTPTVNKRSSMYECAKSKLETTLFDPEQDPGSACKLLTDREQDFFAGMGSSELGPCCKPLALYLDEALPTEGTCHILELGAGCGAPSIWIW